MGINFRKLFSAVSLALILSFSVLAILPHKVLALSPEEKARCDAFKAQFKAGGTNIMGTGPFFCTASDTILTVINYALVLSGTITVLFLIVGGFWYLTSAGNEEQAEKGKKTLINSVIGLVVIILAFTIVRIVSGTLTGLGK